MSEPNNINLRQTGPTHSSGETRHMMETTCPRCGRKFSVWTNADIRDPDTHAMTLRLLRLTQCPGCTHSARTKRITAKEPELNFPK